MTGSEPNIPPPIGIDTNVLIHNSHSEKALSKIADREERKSAILQHRRARRLLRRCHEEKRPVYLSIISVGEFLVKVQEARRDEMIRSLEQQFTIVPYNRKAALIAASLVETTKNPKKAVRVTGGRPVVMADTKIVASLIAAGARHLYLCDAGAVKLALPCIKRADCQKKPTTCSITPKTGIYSATTSPDVRDRIGGGDQRP